jgi:hypothetical protein
MIGKANRSEYNGFEKIVCCSEMPRGGGTPHRATKGRTKIECRQRSHRIVGKSLCCASHEKKKVLEGM